MKTAPKTNAELMEDGQGLVHSLAARIHRGVPVRVDLDDLVAYGELGLAEAARDFDPERGAQFTTFAYYRIRGAIYDGLSKMSWTSRAYYRRLRFEQMANQALAENRVAESGEVEDDARWLGNTTEKLAIVFFAASKDEEGGLRDSTIEDPNAQVAHAVAFREISQKLHELINDLPGNEQRLIRSVYYEGATLKEVADRMGCNKSWTSRLHARILEKLGRQLRRLGA